MVLLTTFMLQIIINDLMILIVLDIVETHLVHFSHIHFSTISADGFSVISGIIAIDFLFLHSYNV